MKLSSLQVIIISSVSMLLFLEPYKSWSSSKVVSSIVGILVTAILSALREISSITHLEMRMAEDYVRWLP